MACNCTNPFYGLPLQNGTCNAASSVMFMTLVNTLLRDDCAISDVCGRITPTLQPDNEYDFIVIGGGGAGPVLAGRLTENPHWKVLLLEQGNDEPVGSQVPSFAYNFLANNETTIYYPTEPQKNACHENENSECRYVRAKILGGCGVVNGMTYMRGVPNDYDHWAKLGNTGWSYKDVLPYFRKSEDNGNIGVYTSTEFHGIGGPISVERFPSAPDISHDILKAARSIGYKTPSDLNADVTEGFTISQTMSKNGTRDSTARAYLRPARFRPNLHIMLNSTATKIHFIKENGSSVARSVEFYYKGQRYNVNVKKEVIVTGGTIGSPQLLLLSGIGPKADLEDVNVDVVHDLPGVGQNFQNHVSLFIQFNLKKVRDTNLLNLESLKEYLLLQKGPLSSTGIAQLGSRISSSENRNKNWPDIQIYFSGYSANCTYDCGTPGLPANPKQPNGTRRITFQVTLVRPKSKGYIKLRSNDPVVKPIIQPNYLEKDYDVKAIISGIRTVIKMGTVHDLKQKYGSELVQGRYGNCSTLHKFGTDDFWECAIKYSTYPENHLTGTCKMGPQTDNLAVVNPQLKVYGTSNVRVADASAFPNIVAANIFATVVVVAEKAADYIKNDWS
ncbi:glucose dehydrogenase [FAD, quinone] [Agrilus planipennis]|uniref:Glucose dehydrogenase [FAD, quinone] n=1 Tax=Agrilus planipennis TaxID=224129 RepID=A0A1W4WJG2_AGRPL|nr:glucose dehydrogenase [FAD, quinone] [Agrilus planipennis]